jgi:hypothetical protein
MNAYLRYTVEAASTLQLSLDPDFFSYLNRKSCLAGLHLGSQRTNESMKATP